ncbi:hypothetical protein DPSP01_006114 [Paraphaeosphaeria sporulosa]|uniref:Uncharacterized protein n=1 Tax=Paraphaeosphaeria sporulosa TaxID=1460663 RepID=A0A177BTT7_9PLEO|nr:uncharacterized protein CC84DRAFT_1264796 [Paraphaeosphaeria sporulosa]OAF98823.1 hypothetical protein CC84DRAFT_1264796 [Paraphaeosphaeria sporulosa]
MPEPITLALGAGAIGLGYKAIRKAKKHHREKEARKQNALTAAETQSINSDVRQVTRHFTRSTVGGTLAASLSHVLPHMVLPAGMNVYLFKRAKDDWRKLNAYMKEKGATVRKRDVARGIGRALVEKAILVPITLGHDDFLLAVPQGTMSTAVAAHAALLEVPGIGEANKLIQAPVEIFQQDHHIPTADERLEDMKQGLVDMGGWNAPAKDLAANVGIAGTLAAATEYLVDRPLEYREGKLQSVQ